MAKSSWTSATTASCGCNSENAMFLTSERLPHVLSPASYWSEQHYRRELAALFAPAWHIVGTLDEFERPGDFITCELLGRPIQVRNFAGELVAASNVCAHRHCLISSEASGHTQRMTCQYHGWEYGADGYTRRIPEANNFAPIDREQLRLNVYRVACCGRLVFVCLAEAPPTCASISAICTTSAAKDSAHAGGTFWIGIPFTR